MTQSAIINAMQQWINTVIVKYHFCPFARPVMLDDSIHYQVTDCTEVNAIADQLLKACQDLDQQPQISTTLLILSRGFEVFDDYLDLLDILQQVIIDPHYLGTYQLASFHPEYCFADSDSDDPANYTNRSPYPALHLIREQSIDDALSQYDDPEQIPERNTQLARRKGAAHFKALLSACYQPPKP